MFYRTFIKETVHRVGVYFQHRYTEPDIQFMFSCTELSFMKTGYVAAMKWQWKRIYSLKCSVFWDIMPCNLLKVIQRFGRTYRLHLQENHHEAGSKHTSMPFFFTWLTLTMEGMCSCETSFDFQQSTRHCIPPLCSICKITNFGSILFPELPPDPLVYMFTSKSLWLLKGFANRSVRIMVHIGTRQWWTYEGNKFSPLFLC
jgi:hypothetical protein